MEQSRPKLYSTVAFTHLLYAKCFRKVRSAKVYLKLSVNFYHNKKLQKSGTLKCLNIGTPKNNNFPFVPNGKFMVLSVPRFKHVRVLAILLSSHSSCMDKLSRG